MSIKQGVKTVDVPIPMKSLEAQLIGEAESKLIAELNAEGKKIVKIDHIKRAGGFGEWSATHVTISALWQIDTEDQSAKRNEVININPNNIEPTITRIEIFLEDSNWENARAYANAALDYFPTDYRLYKYLLLTDKKCKSVSALKNCSTSFAANSNYKKLERYADESTKKEFKEVLEYIDKEPIYLRACSTSDKRAAVELFNTIRGYRDSNERIALLQKRIEEEASAKYQAAIEMQEKAETINDYEQVLNAFAKLKNIPFYSNPGKRRDILDQYNKTKEKYNELSLEKEYTDAGKLLDSGELSKVKEAKITYDKLKGYKDSDKKAEVAQTIINDLKKKNKKKVAICAAISAILLVGIIVAKYINQQNHLKESYNTAIAHYNKMDFQTAKGIFDELSDYKDSAEWSKKCSYSEAIVLYESGDYEKAWDLFKPLSRDDYEDATEWAIKCSNALNRLDDLQKFVIHNLTCYAPKEWKIADVDENQAIAYPEESLSDEYVLTGYQVKYMGKAETAEDLQYYFENEGYIPNEFDDIKGTEYSIKAISQDSESGFNGLSMGFVVNGDAFIMLVFSVETTIDIEDARVMILATEFSKYSY